MSFSPKYINEICSLIFHNFVAYKSEKLYTLRFINVASRKSETLYLYVFRGRTCTIELDHTYTNGIGF